MLTKSNYLGQSLYIYSKKKKKKKKKKIQKIIGKRNGRRFLSKFVWFNYIYTETKSSETLTIELHLKKKKEKRELKNV